VKNSEYLLIIVEDQYGTVYQEEFSIVVEEVYNGPTGMALSDTLVLEDMPVGSPVAKLIVEDEKATNSYTYTLHGPYNQGVSGFDAASFYLEGDTLKTAVVFDREVADTCYLLVELLDAYGNQLSRAFTIQIASDQSGATEVISVTVEQDLIYPNPADRMVTLGKPDHHGSLEIYELATGRKVFMADQIAETLDVSEMPEGIYLVVVRSKSGVSAQKLLIQH
jgi:hypothetical protein